MRQDTTSALAGLASFATLQELLAARSSEGSAEALMTFEACEVELGKAVRGLENELKSADLARDDVEADAVIVDGKTWRKCLEQQPKTSLSASGPITVARTLDRPADGGQCSCPLERRAGMIGGLYTPVLARQVAYLMGHMTSEATSQVCTELGISGPSRSRCVPMQTSSSAAAEEPLRPSAQAAERGLGTPPCVLGGGASAAGSRASRDRGRGRVLGWGDGARPRGAAPSQGHPGGRQAAGMGQATQWPRRLPGRRLWHGHAR